MMGLENFDPNIPKQIPRITLKQRLDLTPFSNGFWVYQTDGQKGFYYFADGLWFFLQSVTSTAGTTRPTKPYLGQSFFDTFLGYRIDWNGTNWVNSDGATV